jgi:hypothetical protein
MLAMGNVRFPLIADARFSGFGIAKVHPNGDGTCHDLSFAHRRQPWRQDEVQKLHQLAGKGPVRSSPAFRGGVLHGVISDIAEVIGQALAVGLAAEGHAHALQRQPG